MADYTRGTGNGGVMLIRDTGYTIEFWLSAGSQTYAYQMPWGYDANGAFSGWLQYRFETGGGWRHIGSVNVTTSQNVTFHLGRTGTSGLGGPTDFTVFINRASIPAPPNIVNVVTASTSLTVTITDGANNGSGIDAREIWWGRYTTGAEHITPIGSTVALTGLTPGTVYYIWAREHNALGWSGFAGPLAFRTYSVPDPPNAPSVASITQNSAYATFQEGYDGGTPIREWQIGYGLRDNPDTVVEGKYYQLNGLVPGATYYLYSRVRNDVGWSLWRGSTQVVLKAGGWITANGTVHRAVPYVNVNGTWKLAKPMVRVAGVWKETA